MQVTGSSSKGIPPKQTISTGGRGLQTGVEDGRGVRIGVGRGNGRNEGRGSGETGLKKQGGVGLGKVIGQRG